MNSYRHVDDLMARIFVFFDPIQMWHQLWKLDEHNSSKKEEDIVEQGEDLDSKTTTIHTQFKTKSKNKNRKLRILTNTISLF